MILLLLLTSQYLFEQNKIQYTSHEWMMHETEHFHIYYYKSEKVLVPFAADVLEESYNRLKKRFNYNERKNEDEIPVILYKSHPDFQGTNVILDRIPEGVGGFAELFKNRIVIPFTGSYSDFRHVLNHELVHIFQYRILYGTGVNAIKRAITSSIPLWFIEGMAELESSGWDQSAETYIRDAVLNNKLFTIPQLNRIGGYPIYKEGQSVLYYIREKYGEEKIGEIMSKLKITNSFEGAIVSVLGIDLNRLNSEWTKELKKQYWPIIEGKQYISEIARPIVTHSGFENLYNYAPAVSPSGDKIVYFTDEVGEVQIRLVSSLTKEDLGLLVKGGRSAMFESLHLMDGHTSFSPDGERIVFPAMVKNKDVLYILGIRERKILKKIDLQLDLIRWPEFSPDGKKIAFVGLKNGASDIYVYDLQSETLLNVTHDRYSDNYPAWKGDSLLFVSDRPETEKWDYNTSMLYLSDLKGNIIKYLSFGEQIIAPKVYNSDVYFISYRDGGKNLYIYKSDSSVVRQLTDLIGSVDDFSISNSGHVVVSIYTDLGWDIYFIDAVEDLEEKEPNPPRELDKEEEISVMLVEEDKMKKDSRAPLHFGVDYFTGTLGYYSDYGVFGYLALGMSDMLGNHQIYALFNNTDLAESSFYIMYLYLKRRVDLATSLVRQKGVFSVSEGYLAGDIWNVNTDVIFPLDRFKRIEMGLSSYYLSGDLLVPVEGLPGWYTPTSTDLPEFGLLGHMDFIQDNAVWGYMNPIKGFRGRISYSRPLLAGENLWDISTVSTDLRKYFYLSGDYSFALRFLIMHSWGRDSRDFGTVGIGGGRSVRGYDYNTQIGRTAGLLSMELRLPLIKRLDLGFPPISLGGIEGALFTDIGVATDDYRELQFFTTENNWIKLADPIMSFGVEFRLNLGITILNFDISRRTDLNTILPDFHYDLHLGLPF
ncbi:PD40 domain-containing protein [candidate division WOR-3 bacterium]|nr:PD40 domain-containing protein [candidate division WOR-3 bacterium]